MEKSDDSDEVQECYAEASPQMSKLNATENSLCDEQHHGMNSLASCEMCRIRKSLCEMCTLINYGLLYFLNEDKIRAFRAFEDARSLSLLQGNDQQKMYIALNLENTRSSFVDAWHWRMLNDTKRNRVFQEAIRRVIEQYITNNRKLPFVLDIGCGSGIFSIAATRMGAILAACEMDPTMAKIAENCIKINQADVSLWCGHSDAYFQNSRLARSVDVIVTETLDSAVFGENIVRTLEYASRHVPNATVIPKKVDVQFTLIESYDIAVEHYCHFKLRDQEIQSNGCREGVFISAECNVASEYSVKNLGNTAAYTCEYLDELPNSYRIIGGPTTCLNFDFENGQQREKFLKDVFAFAVRLTANVDGVITAVAAWFRLTVYGDIELCTAPDQHHCWQQTVFPIFPPRRLAAGERLEFEAVIDDNRLTLRPLPNSVAPVRPLSIRRVDNETSPLYLDVIQSRSINDFYARCIAATAGVNALIDCSALLLCREKYGPDALAGGAANPFSCIPSNLVLEHMECSSSHPTIKDLQLHGRILEQEEAFPQLHSSHSTAILHWPINMELMSLNCEMTDIALEAYRKLKITGAKCRLIPSAVRLCCQLVESIDLLERSRLRLPDDADENSFSADHCDVNLNPMNAFRARYLHGLRESSFAHIPLSDVFELVTLEITDNSISPNLYRKGGEMTTNRFGICTAVLYWFELVDDCGNVWSPRPDVIKHSLVEEPRSLSWVHPYIGLCPYCPLDAAASSSVDRNGPIVPPETCAKFSAFILEDYVCVAPGCSVHISGSVFNDYVIFDEAPRLVVKINEDQALECERKAETNATWTSIRDEIMKRRDIDESILAQTLRQLVGEMQRCNHNFKFHMEEKHVNE